MGLQEPERAAEGLGGTYFFKDDLGNKVAIVKPCDEEPLAPNNPKVCMSVMATMVVAAAAAGAGFCTMIGARKAYSSTCP